MTGEVANSAKGVLDGHTRPHFGFEGEKARISRDEKEEARRDLSIRTSIRFLLRGLPSAGAVLLAGAGPRPPPDAFDRATPFLRLNLRRSRASRAGARVLSNPAVAIDFIRLISRWRDANGPLRSGEELWGSRP